MIDNHSFLFVLLFLLFLSKHITFTHQVNCADEKNKNVEKCMESGSETCVYTYSQGHELLRLELETMFDVNSIMSNLLQ